MFSATIRYEAVAIADVPWGKDQSKKVEFFVQGGKDLNDHMETLEKVYINYEQFCYIYKLKFNISYTTYS